MYNHVLILKEVMKHRAFLDVIFPQQLTETTSLKYFLCVANAVRAAALATLFAGGGVTRGNCLHLQGRHQKSSKHLLNCLFGRNLMLRHVRLFEC